MTPFVSFYNGMQMFAVLAAVLVGGGVAIALYLSGSFSVAAWYTGATLEVFAFVGRAIMQRESLVRQSDAARRGSSGLERRCWSSC